MYVVCVTLFVKPGSELAFVAASEKNHRGALLEEGCSRFDVLVHEEDATRFFLYEVYRDKEAFAAHQRTAHYLEWRDAVAPLMAQPRQGVKHRSLFPEGERVRWASSSS
jgi:(4S)-4-hydroxy-5-phosphonooxypentane-2,3-dione isomerase